MKVSYKWLQDYVDIDITPEKVAQILTDQGLEVEELIHYSNYSAIVNHLVVGKVLETYKHPDADKLTVTKTDIGGKEPLQIICGAPNVATGQKVVVAKPGTEVMDKTGKLFTIKKAKIRGVVSEGMLCAEDEIGISDDHSGILVLDDKAEVGKPLNEILNVYVDDVFDIAITPNRTDAVSHIGVARDLAAGTGKKVVHPQDPVIDEQEEVTVKINIEDIEACPRYSGLVISGLKIDESPEWLKNRLQAIGLQPINNVVDITNYVMFEMGHPLHAFDLREIPKHQIVVRLSDEGFKFMTLDGKERTLTGEELMICNDKEPIGIAGVMGGEGSGVKDDTQSIFIESAYFNPSIIRKATKYHQLNSDAAFRFERGADPNVTIKALKRAAALIIEIAGGEVSSSIFDKYPNKVNPVDVKLEMEYLNRLLGNDIPVKEVEKVLSNLEFEIKERNPHFLKVTVPTYRHDVTRPADLVEEFVRIYSLNKIGTDVPSKAVFNHFPEVVSESKVATISTYLKDNGFFQMVNPPMTNRQLYKKMKKETAHWVEIVNPLNKEFDILRENLLYSGLQTLAYNLNRQNYNSKLFEIGKVYFKKGKDNYSEKRMLSVIISGETNDENWTRVNRKADFYFMKGIVINLFRLLGFDNIDFESGQNEDIIYSQQIMINNKKMAAFGLVNPVVAKQFDIESEVFYASLELDEAIAQSEKQEINFKSIPKYPSVTRDISMIVPDKLFYKTIREKLKQVGKDLIREINIFDVYEGDKIRQGYKSYAVRVLFQDEDRTLKDDEVDRIMNQIMQKLEKELDIEIRK